MIRPFATSLCFLVVSWAAAAGASDPPDDRARALFREGINASKEERWGDARRALDKAVDIERAPILLYSLAVAERNTGKLVAAARHFREFLSAPARGRTRAFRGPAKRALAEVESRIAHVVIVVEPASADVSVRIDDEELPRGAFGRPHPVDPGEHVITASAPRYLHLRHTITIEPKGREPVSLRLAAAPGHVPLVPAVLMGVGGAVMLAGVAVGVVGVVEATDGRRRLDDGARTKAILGNVTAGAGLLTLGMGLLFLVVNDGTESQAAESHGAVRPWSGVDGAGIELRF